MGDDKKEKKKCRITYMRGKLLIETLIIGFVSLFVSLIILYCYRSCCLFLPVFVINSFITMVTIFGWQKDKDYIINAYNSRIFSFVIFVLSIFNGGIIFELVNSLGNTVLSFVLGVFIFLPSLWWIYVFLIDGKDGQVDVNKW